MKKEKFDWKGYFRVANSLNDYTDEAKLRVGVSKFYNSAFCLSRNYLLEEKLFLDDNSKIIMKGNGASVHSETKHIFRNHDEINPLEKGEKIAKYLNTLRNYRNEVDYNDVTQHDVEFMYNRSKKLSNEVINLLDELN